VVHRLDRAGHALEGSYSFGVRAAAAAVEQSVQQSPLARGGWVRILLRGTLYVAALLFVAALVLPRFLRGGLGWLVPAALGDAPDIRARRARATTLVGDVGWLAVGAAAGATLAEATDAGAAPSRLLLSVTSCWSEPPEAPAWPSSSCCSGRCSCTRGGGAWRRCSACWRSGAVAASGHASSASSRVLSIVNDWLHLISGAAWLGGIGLIGVIWTRTLRRAEAQQRRDVARLVLVPFGRVALPAFLLVTSRPGEPADPARRALVAVADRLRQATGRQDRCRRTRRSSERAACLAAAAGAARSETGRAGGAPRTAPLAAGAHRAGARSVRGRDRRRPRRLPPTAPQLGELDEAGAAVATCDPCPLPKPAADELPVATRAGTLLVAAWVRRSASGVSGTVRISDLRGRPAAVIPSVDGATLAACGVGCHRFRTSPAGAVLRVSVPGRGRRYVAELPTRWDTTANRLARRLLVRAEAEMRRVRSVRQIEEVTSGPGSFARTTYRLQAPDRMTFRTDRGVETVVIGRRQWYRTRPGPYEISEYGAGLPFLTRSWFRWSVYGRTVRLLDLRHRGRTRVAELALFDEATPAWIRLTVDLATMHVTEEETSSKSHITRTRYRAFDRALPIRTPTGARRER